MKKNQEKKQPITERIKTMKDVIRQLGEENHLVKEYQYWKNAPEELREEYTGVFLQLKMLCEALNEGDFPLTHSDFVYWPWIDLYRYKEDIPSYYDKDRIFGIPKSISGVIFGGLALNGASCGFASARALNAPSRTNAYVGSRLCFKNRDLALYAVKQFAELWIKFYFM